MTRGRAKAFYCVVTVVFALAALTIFEVDVNGSLLGGLWQLVHGKQVKFAGLEATLPPYWLAIRSKNNTLLAHLEGKNTVEIFLVGTNVNSSHWEQGNLRWLESMRAEYVAEGYELLPPPSVTVMGRPAACVEAELKGSTEIRLQCGVADGQMLVTFKGRGKDVPALLSILASLRPSR